MIKISNVDFEFDAFDAEDVEKAKKEMNQVVYLMENPPKNLDRVGIIKHTVKIVGDCFNNLFGVDAANKIFKGKINMKLALKSFEDLTAGIQAQDRAFEKEMEATTEKYSSNRAARRNNKSYIKKNKK